MEKADIKNQVLEYAASRTTPFTAAQAFEAIDAIETTKQVSDALGRLYNQRILARRKVDKVRYAYILANMRYSQYGAGEFEMAPEQQTDEPKAPEQAPEKHAMENIKNIGVSAESATIAMQRMAETPAKAIPDKKPNTPEKPAEPTTLNVQFRQPEAEQKHSHYFVNVSKYNKIDIYRITELYKCSQMAAHITKKALCSGIRGHKDLATDIKEIIDTANRWLEMIAEDRGNN